jgi:hypothetical protein
VPPYFKVPVSDEQRHLVSAQKILLRKTEKGRDEKRKKEGEREVIGCPFAGTSSYFIFPSLSH